MSGLESSIASALIFGLISAATLPLGAALGLLWRPPDRIMAVLLAFGGGALLAALTIDLVAPGVDRGHFEDLALGALLGGLLFKLLDWLVNRKGGYLRKPSTAMTYWRGQARERLHRILIGVRRTQPMGALSRAAEEQLLSIMLIRDIPAGACLYRADDPAQNLYIIEDGEVELRDPQQHAKVFERLRKHDAFGRMSFATGLSRATEAYTARDTRLLILPRDAFMDLLEDSDELRALMAGRIGGDEVATYLRERHGLSAEEVSAWQQQALASLAATGHYDPPVHSEAVSADLVGLLQHEQRQGLFSALSEPTLGSVAERLIHKTDPEGYTFFHRGQPADRLYLLRQGTVYLFDPEDRSRKPTVVQAGESFGAFAFLTEGTHSVTAVAHEQTQVSILRHRDFEDLLDESPELRRHLSEYLRRNQMVSYLTRQHRLDARRAAQWIDNATKSIAGGKAFPPLSEMTKQVAGHKGAAMAMFLGILLDGIPESFVIGANVLATGGISLSLIGGLLLANFPEALSSAAAMKEQGMRTTRILTMWTSLMLITGIGAALGAAFLEGAPVQLFALIEGIAAGAMLTMVAETMLPEAFHKGGGVVGLSTLAGFLAAVFFNTLG
ncbi:MAG: cyclic nucleotide-binding domain-containing protein [Chromatiaceae bacterium]|nr:cyclic nucleotide-binding domain-containing protein [Chromatiaceae bacterium]